VGIPVHERSLKSGEVKACMLSGLYVMIMLVDKSKLGDPWPWSPDSCPALTGAKPSYTGASYPNPKPNPNANSTPNRTPTLILTQSAQPLR